VSTRIRKIEPASHMKITHLLFIAFFFSCRLFAQSGGSYDLEWSTIDSGGGTSSGGRYSLTGVIGQPDAGQLTGGDFTLEGGFLCELGIPVNDNGPLLKIRRAAALGFAELYWPVEVKGFTLEATTDLSNVPWGLMEGEGIDSSTEHVVTVPIIANRYFRLRAIQP
jgi:hypothetical protein